MNPVNGLLGSPSNLNLRALLRPNFLLLNLTKFSSLIISSVRLSFHALRVAGYASRASCTRMRSCARSSAPSAWYWGAASRVRVGTLASFVPAGTAALWFCIGWTVSEKCWGGEEGDAR